MATTISFDPQMGVLLARKDLEYPLGMVFSKEVVGSMVGSF